MILLIYFCFCYFICFSIFFFFFFLRKERRLSKISQRGCRNLFKMEAWKLIMYCFCFLFFVFCHFYFVLVDQEITIPPLIYSPRSLNISESSCDVSIPLNQPKSAHVRFFAFIHNVPFFSPLTHPSQLIK